MTAIVKAMAHCCHTAFVGVGLNPIADTQLVAKMTRNRLARLGTFASQQLL